MSQILEKPDTEAALAAGCSDNNDCPDYNVCENRQCIDPCAQNDPCAKNAFCKVINHSVICTCPTGFVGSPEISCLPRKY